MWAGRHGTQDVGVDGKKSERLGSHRCTASREKLYGADPELSSDLRRALDRMVMTEGVPVNLTLQLTRREKLINNLRWNMPVLV
jgi:hypothetical protein